MYSRAVLRLFSTGPKKFTKSVSALCIVDSFRSEVYSNANWIISSYLLAHHALPLTFLPVVHDKVYDVSKYIDDHPGGDILVAVKKQALACRTRLRERELC